MFKNKNFTAKHLVEDGSARFPESEKILHDEFVKMRYCKKMVVYNSRETTDYRRVQVF